jgi:hypothetical protein
MKNSVTFNYNPYIHLDAFKYSLNTVREHYPTSDIFVHFYVGRTDRDPFQSVSEEYSCKFILRDEPSVFISRKDAIETNIPKMIESANRWKYTCDNTDAEWVLLMEEDVIIKRPIVTFPTADVGVCRSDYTRPGGGAVFNRKKFIEAMEKVDIVDIMYHVHDGYWASDVVLEHIFRRNGCTFEEWMEYADKGYRDHLPHAVYHGYKDLYVKS